MQLEMPPGRYVFCRKMYHAANLLLFFSIVQILLHFLHLFLLEEVAFEDVGT